MVKQNYLQNLVKNVIDVVKEGGKIFASAHDNILIDQKLNTRDLVTQYDKNTQDFLEKQLSLLYPEVQFLGEEGDELSKVDIKHGKYFIIDPIDGTSNFINNLRHSAISVGYAEYGEVLAGVVYNPYTNELFTAIKGNGAYLNGNKISVNNKRISEGLVGFGTAVYYDELIEKTKNVFAEMLVSCNDLRRLGSAAIDLCYVAEGRFCGFFECRLCPWDYAAGELILTEAGGVISDFIGNELPLDKKSSVLAGNKTAYAELEKIINKTMF